MNEGNNLNNDFNQNVNVQPNEQQPIYQAPVQPAQQPIYQAPVQPTYTNPAPDSEQPKKSGKGLNILLLIIILALIGYIVYDKDLLNLKKNNNTNNNSTNTNTDNNTNNGAVSNELVKYDKSQFSRKENKSSMTDFEVFTVKNSNLVVEVKLSSEKDTESIEEEEGHYENVRMSLFVNGVKKDTAIISRYFLCNDANDCDMLDAFPYPISNAIVTEDSFGTIKSGDKYYLYLEVDSGRMRTGDSSEIYIFDKDGNVLDTKGITFYGGNSSQNNFSLSESCVTYKYGKPYDDGDSNDHLGTHFFEEDAIYYLVLSRYDDDADYANEYKLTIVDGKVKKEKLNTCKVVLYGEKGWDVYEDMPADEQ